jgi:hypothetical protein
MVRKLRIFKRRTGSGFYNLIKAPSWFCNKLGRVGSLDLELGTGELVEQVENTGAVITCHGHLVWSRSPTLV